MARNAPRYTDGYTPKQLAAWHATNDWYTQRQAARDAAWHRRLRRVIVRCWDALPLPIRVVLIVVGYVVLVPSADNWWGG